MNQKELFDNEHEFFIRKINELDDFLYESQNSHLKREAGRQFDHLEMIFIIGSQSVLPWQKGAGKLLVLLRMCLKVKKILFASGFAMQCLMFLAASNMQTVILFKIKISIINSEN